MDELLGEVNYILRARFRGRTVVFLRSDGKRFMGDAFEIAYSEGISDMEFLAALVGDGELDNGFVYLF